MLGISSDSINDTATPVSDDSCKCSVLHQCMVGSECECQINCIKYEQLYTRIKSQGQRFYGFLTFSPKPKTQAGYELNICNSPQDEEYKDYKRFVKDFFRNNIYVKDYIVVPELTNKGQIHYHAFYSFKNRVGIIKSITQPLFHRGNVLNMIGNTPKKGIHYLFKSQQTMYEYFDYKSSIFTVDE